jgi:hypothetical protein
MVRSLSAESGKQTLGKIVLESPKTSNLTHGGLGACEPLHEEFSKCHVPRTEPLSVCFY